MPARRLSYPYVEPIAVHQSRTAIEVLAEQCAKRWGFRDGVSMDEACRNSGVDIEYSRPPNEVMLDVPLDARPVIWLPRNGRRRDDRVIAATALGHWAMHVAETLKVNPGCGVQALYEPDSFEARQEASLFGLTFLMPTDEFMETWSAGRSQAASAHFDVPTEITYQRAKGLELGDIA